MIITFYKDNGEIDGYIESSDPYQIEANKVGNWVMGKADPATQYIKNGQITDRPNQQTNLTGLTLTDLPNPCTIFINGQSYECESETAELEFDQPTIYTIRVEAWPYQDWETTYENKA
ncbi:hypothetical protein [Oligella urethralis]|uniref:hypothetical protein n=1 Tax=Oligella urethralis TaxID=90245 RepID=UPI0006613F84|nr:hypothetical protein [Oligella urethralis]